MTAVTPSSNLRILSGDDNVENDISSILGRSSRPTGWRQELAVWEATELLNEFGKDA